MSMPVCVTRITVRLGKRSTMEPPHSANGSSGIRPMKLIIPSAAAEPVSW